MGWWLLVSVIALGVLSPGAILFLLPTVIILLLLGWIFSGSSPDSDCAENVRQGSDYPGFDRHPK